MKVVKEKEAYTVSEVAARTALSRQTIIRIFENERGVLIMKSPEAMHKRSYRTIRIPRAVYERVIARLTVR
jgi:transcriptional regulator GlxA family with amidase domain